MSGKTNTDFACITVFDCTWF